jgi:hypothetical protein
MSTIIVEGVSNSNLPLAGTYSERINSLGTCAFWLQADPAFLTVNSGDVTEILNRLGGAGKYVPSAAGREATIDADALNGFEALVMRGTDTEATAGERTIYVPSGITPLAENEPFTLVAVFKTTNLTTANTLLNRTVDSSNRLFIQHLTTGNIRLTYGSTFIQTAAAVGEWHVLIAGFDGTDLLMNLNGADITPVTAAGGTGTGDLILGSTTGGSTTFVWDGEWTDIMAFRESILSSATKTALIRDFVSEVYGIPA